MKRPARVVVPVDGSLPLFDEHPINLSSFTLRAKRAVVVGTPTLDECVAAMRFAHAAAESAPYWWGDLMRYADSRAEWEDRLAQAVEMSGLARQTLLTYTSVCNRVAAAERQLAPTMAHAAEVAALPAPEQAQLLTRAARSEWSVKDLRRAVKERRSRQVTVGQSETMHTVEVTVRLTVEADTPYGAEEAAWGKVKSAVAGLAHAHVVGAHALPQVGAVRLAKKGPREP